MMDKELKDLGQFFGTEGYTNIMGVDVTDGITYIMQNGYSWFVTDMIVILKMKLKEEPFCVVKLKLDGNKGKAIITDGDEKVLYTQDYKYTDAKKELDLYFTNNVLMLCREY